MGKAYHRLTQLLGDEVFTRTILFVVITASIFALVFHAPAEVVEGMIVLGAGTALLEHKFWTNKKGRK